MLFFFSTSELQDNSLEVSSPCLMLTLSVRNGLHWSSCFPVLCWVFLCKSRRLILLAPIVADIGSSGPSLPLTPPPPVELSSSASPICAAHSNPNYLTTSMSNWIKHTKYFSSKLDSEVHDNFLVLKNYDLTWRTSTLLKWQCSCCICFCIILTDIRVDIFSWNISGHPVIPMGRRQQCCLSVLSPTPCQMDLSCEQGGIAPQVSPYQIMKVQNSTSL